MCECHSNKIVCICTVYVCGWNSTRVTCLCVSFVSVYVLCVFVYIFMVQVLSACESVGVYVFSVFHLVYFEQVSYASHLSTLGADRRYFN